MGDAIVLFFGSGELVPADGVCIVLGAVGQGDKAKLSMLSHDLSVEIIVRLVILMQRAPGDEAVKIFTSLGVNAGISRGGSLG